MTDLESVFICITIQNLQGGVPPSLNMNKILAEGLKRLFLIILILFPFVLFC